MMDSPDYSRNAHATEHEALLAVVHGTGPTAQRYQSALVRYMDALVGEHALEDESPGEHRVFPALTVADVMTRGVVSAYAGALFKEIAAALERNHIDAVPVVDADHKVVGVVAATDLVTRLGAARPVPRGHRFAGWAETARKESAATAAELMTWPPVTTTAEETVAAAAHRLVHHRIRSMPVVDEDGVLVGMVSHLDLIKTFLRRDEDIRADVVRDVVPAGEGVRPNGVRVTVDEGVVTLTGRVRTALTAKGIVLGARHAPGVVDVRDELGCETGEMSGPRGS
jgi:CBS domain-containing protein